jgi:dipeptidase
VKPDKKVTVQDLLAIFRDAYDGTEFDMTRGLMVVNRKGETVKSPAASSFLNGDLRELLHIKRERSICSPTATYLQITQSRGWLPDPIGGVVWLGYDLPATTPHTPFYCGIAKMPDAYMVDGRWGFKNESAWWAFRTVSKLAQIRYQDMSKEIEKVWKPIEDKAFAEQKNTEDEALALFKKDPAEAKKFLTDYCLKLANGAVEAYWKLERDLWTRFNYMF